MTEEEAASVLEKKQKFVDHQASKYKAEQDKALEENKEEPAFPEPLQVKMGESCPICTELVIPK
eukprot:CAMPEP_0170507378 /NCGR_PEP_ID=MMETSP0208-20121228/58630_1 /TAXON_ID=197538 /ORGANISM="Strombidium inclinatum, Strain S3" /LENGTH=63 /DNA_ID=CAMNT_0010789517 /DNA_START=267 /DNA_END=458 /DNA_ORIENTATION=+